jgi:acyl-CoA synthetase (NDP forming)
MAEDSIAQIIKNARSDGRSQLLEDEIYDILEGLGIPTARHFCWNLESGEIRIPLEGSHPKDLAAALRGLPGEKVVLKIQSPDILHKTEAGGLRVCQKDAVAVGNEGEALWERVKCNSPGARLSHILVMEWVDYDSNLGHELLVGWRWDRDFGPVLFVGAGGLLTEWFNEVTGGGSLIIHSAQPFRKEKIRQEVCTHPALRVFFAPSRLYPESAPVPCKALLDVLEKLSRLGSPENDIEVGRYDLVELEVNPMIMSRDGRLLALDGIGRTGEIPAPRSPRPVEKIRRLLYPRSVAILGASARGLNPGRIILRNLKVADGIPYGRLYAVHPSGPDIDGVPCYRSVSDLPEKVDLAIISIPAQGAVDAIKDLAEGNLAETIILIPGGFGERGRRDLVEAIKTSLREARRGGDGPVLLGGNCLGIVSHQYNTFFLPQYKLPFRGLFGENLAAISQSGAYLVTLSSNLDGIVFPRASISYGNEMDLTVADFVEYYVSEEPEAKTLAVYVEGFHPLDGHRLMSLARGLRDQDRTLIVSKGGKTALGAKAAASHTASMAGDYAVARSILEAEGVVVPATLNEFEDFVKVFTLLGDRRPSGRRVAIITNAGFEAAAALDRLYDLEAAKFSSETVERLRKRLPDIAHTGNPVDATPMATTEDFIGAVEILLQDAGVDALIVSAVPVTPALEDLAPDLTGLHPENIYNLSSLPQEFIRLYKKTRKPIVAAVDSGRLYDPLVVVIERGGIPVYRKIDRASRALSCFCDRWLRARAE